MILTHAPARPRPAGDLEITAPSASISADDTTPPVPPLPPFPTSFNSPPNMTITPPAWKADLDRDGYVVIKNVVPPERCVDYSDRALGWLEGFDLGFKRDNPKTWDQDHMPIHGAGGLHTQYGVPHEDWVWECRT